MLPRYKIVTPSVLVVAELGLVVPVRNVLYLVITNLLISAEDLDHGTRKLWRRFTHVYVRSYTFVDDEFIHPYRCSNSLYLKLITRLKKKFQFRDQCWLNWWLADIALKRYSDDCMKVQTSNSCATEHLIFARPIY